MGTAVQVTEVVAVPEGVPVGRGVAVVVGLMDPVLVTLWDTVALGDGVIVAVPVGVSFGRTCAS